MRNRMIGLFYIFILLFTFPYSTAALDSHPWIPVDIPWVAPQPGWLDARTALPVEPAGSRGYVQVRNGHFVFKDGTRARLWGINLAYGTCFPPAKEAEVLANRLAQLGFNAVRLHALDSGKAPDGIFDFTKGTTRIFDRAQLDRLDYLIFQLEKNGIYIDFNLLVSRPFSAGDKVIAPTLLPTRARYVSEYNTKLVALQQEYAKNLLQHRNPYTKHSYAFDPGVAMVEIANEDSLLHGWTLDLLRARSAGGALPDEYVTELDGLWNTWLAKRYRNRQTLADAWTIGAHPDPLSLIPDGDFETEEWAAWTAGAPVESVPTLQRDLLHPFAGTASLRMDLPSGGSAVLQHGDFVVTPGQRYTVSLALSATANTKARIRVVTVNSNIKYDGIGLGLDATVDVSTEWHENQFSFIAKGTKTNAARLEIKVDLLPPPPEVQTPTPSPSAEQDAPIVPTESAEAPNAEVPTQPIEPVVTQPSVPGVWFDDVRLEGAPIHGLMEEEDPATGSVARLSWGERFTVSSSRAADMTRFYTDVERMYYQRMVRYLKETIGVRVPLGTTNVYAGLPGLVVQSVGDYQDAHVYWDHPSFPGTWWDMRNFTLSNDSLLRNPVEFSQGRTGNLNPISRVALSRLAGYPMVISEWDSAYPTRYEYEMVPLMATYGSFLDWDALYLFDWTGRSPQWAQQGLGSFFDVRSNPVKLAETVGAALSFRRGDIAPARSAYRPKYSDQRTFDDFRTLGVTNNFGVDGVLPMHEALIRRIERQIPGGKTTSRYTQEPLPSQLQTKGGDLLWDVSDVNKARVTLNGRNVQGVIGFVDGTTHKLQNCTIIPEAPGSFTLTSLTKLSIGTSEHLLFTRTGQQANTDQVSSLNGGLSKWGKAPVLVQPVGVTLILPVRPDQQLTVTKIDPMGRPGKTLPVIMDKRGYVVYCAGEDGLQFQLDFSPSPEPTGAPAVDDPANG